MLYYSPSTTNYPSPLASFSWPSGCLRLKIPLPTPPSKAYSLVGLRCLGPFKKNLPKKYYFQVVKGYVPQFTPPPLAFGIHLTPCSRTWCASDAGLPRDTPSSVSCGWPDCWKNPPYRRYCPHRKGNSRSAILST